MTAIADVIRFNNSTGSDSLASGVGPSTAVNSTTEGTTASYSSTTITFSGATDLSGVGAGDLLYLVTSTGRKFFVIASVNDGADTLVVDDAPAGTTSGLSWAIGGKRQLVDDSVGRVLFTTDAKPGWTIELEETGSPYTFAAITFGANGDATTGPITLRGEAGGRVELDFVPASSTNYCVTASGNYWTIENLKVDQANNTTLVKGMFGTSTAGRGWRFRNCEITQVSSTQVDHWWHSDVNATSGTIVEVSDCYIHDTGGMFYNGVQSEVGLVFTRNRVVDTAGGLGGDYAIYVEDVRGISIYENAFASSNADAILIAGDSDGAVVRDNAFYAIGSDAVSFSCNGVIVTGNIFSDSTHYDIVAALTPPVGLNIVDANAHYSPGSGETSGISAGPNEITLSADPFIDAAAGDFNLNATAGGGQDLRDYTEAIAT